MGLQQFERRLERMVEGVFARAFRGGLQPVEIGRRLTREMDLRRTIAPRGTISPNQFTVALSPERPRPASPRSRTSSSPSWWPSPRTTPTSSGTSSSARSRSRWRPTRISARDGPGLRRDGEAGRDRPGQPGAARRPRGSSSAPKPLVVGRLPDCRPGAGRPQRQPLPRRVPARSSGRRPATEAAGEYEVSDMGSTNGTKVNGIPVVSAQVLRDGDPITVGATTIRFERTLGRSAGPCPTSS